MPWQCPRCETYNPDENNRCEVCDTDRYAIEKLRQAIWIDDDSSIEQSYDRALFEHSSFLNRAERSRTDLAIKRVETLKKLWAAIRARDNDTILHIYEDNRDLFQSCSGFSADYLVPVLHARRTAAYQRFLDAQKDGSEGRIVTDGLTALEIGCDLQLVELDRVRSAQLRVSILNRLRAAIAVRNPKAILLAYNDIILDHLDELTADEKEQVRLVTTL